MNHTPTWQEEFDEQWSDAGLEYPNRKFRIKSLVAAEIEKAKAEADKLVEAVSLYNTDPITALKESYENGRDDESIAHINKDLKAYDEGRKDGFETCVELHAKSWIAEGRREERARILAALPPETNEHGDDESDDIARLSKNATLERVRAIIEG